MPNAAILGGSPLGIIGVKSYYDQSGMSTFNAGKTRNIRVTEYNKNSSSAGMLYGNSLFSGYRTFRAWPSIVAKDGVYDTLGTSDVDYYSDPKKDNSTRKELHNNSTYDVSVLNILEKLSGTKAELRPADFAYLKNIGVYSNNRLIIARRFATPTEDNIMVPKQATEISSIATLISWLKDTEDFLSISFGEHWEDAPADFKSILTSMGEDFKINNLGDRVGGMAGATPLPGFTEIFQRNLLSKLGLIEDDAKNMIPAGNPNLIKQAKMRKTIGYDQAGSGLKCTVSIKMTCEYELKYISGIDPTIVWMDLISMIGRFGTSNSETWGLSKSTSSKFKKWLSSPSELISGVSKALGDAIDGMIEELKKVYESMKKKSSDDKKRESSDDKKRESIDKIKKAFEEGVKKMLSGIIQKYRVRIIGIINTYSGMPSTPWHITIGNPLRPTFCSGDMLVEDVSLKFGPILAFNDLPSYITVEFNLSNARPWGLQEIMAKFNSGYLRTIDAQKSYYETSVLLSKNGERAYPEPIGILPLTEIKIPDESNGLTQNETSQSEKSNTSGSSQTVNDTNPSTGNSSITGTSGTSGSLTKSNKEEPTSTTKVGQENKKEISKDAGA